jgi:hypothetical protein
LNIINTYNRPFIGKVQTLLETIHSLDEKWYVEFWDVHYFFLGIEIFSKKKEILKYKNGSKANGKSIA